MTTDITVNFPLTASSIIAQVGALIVFALIIYFIIHKLKAAQKPKPEKNISK
jgi:hypothetical protein